MDRPDHYQILGLEGRKDDRLSFNEVRLAYKRALLLHHPDKMGSIQTKQRISVDDIALAFKIISDPVLRKTHDAYLKTAHTSDHSKAPHTGLETVDLDDLLYDENDRFWHRTCRCGNEGGYLITEVELERHADEGELITGCRGCSLWLRVLFGVEG